MSLYARIRSRPFGYKYEKWYDTKEIARLYYLSTRAVEKWASKNGMPFYYEGGRKYYKWSKEWYRRFCDRPIYKERILKNKFYSSKFVADRNGIDIDIVNEWAKNRQMSFVKKFVLNEEERTGRKGTKYTVTFACFDIQCPNGEIKQFYEQGSDFNYFRDIELHKKDAIAWNWIDIAEFEKSPINNR